MDKFQFSPTASNDIGALTQLCCGTDRVETTTDTIIPDTMGDVDKILLSYATPRIDGYFITENGVEVEGTVDYHLLLSTEGNRLSSLTASEPFEAKIVCEEISGDSKVLLLPILDYVKTKLVNPRKINLRSQTLLSYRIVAPRVTEPTLTGNETLSEEMNVQRKRIVYQGAAVHSVEEKGFNGAVDIELDSGAPSAEEVVSCHVTLTPVEIKTRGDEDNLRSEGVISMVYRTPEGNYFTTEKKISLDTPITLPEGFGGNWHGYAVPHDVSSVLSVNEYGEMKMVEADFLYDLYLYFFANKECSAVTDLYSTEFETAINTTTKRMLTLKRCYSTGLSVNASSAREDVGAENVRNVFMGNVHLRNVSLNTNEEQNKLVFLAEAEISLANENHAVTEEEALFSACSFPYPVRCELDIQERVTPEEMIVDYSISDIRCRADSGRLYCDFELLIRILSTEATPLRYIDKAVLLHDKPLDIKRSPLTLCYPAENDTLWDVAKHYGVTSKDLCRANRLETEDIAGKKVLLIPPSRDNKPIFEKVL